VLGVENHILYFDTIDFKCCFGFFFNKTWDYVVILIHLLCNKKKRKLLKLILCSIYCVNFL
jgi:hypothetical protein